MGHLYGQVISRGRLAPEKYLVQVHGYEREDGRKDLGTTPFHSSAGRTRSTQSHLQVQK